MFVVATGNPADGFVFHGPFLDANFAGDWASEKLKGEDWWTLTVHQSNDDQAVSDPPHVEAVAHLYRAMDVVHEHGLELDEVIDSARQSWCP
jgi:hypothetical protein